MTGAFCI